MSRDHRRTRRRVLTAVGSTTALTVAGCLDDDSGARGEPQYDRGEVGDVDGEPRSPEEMTAAESLAERETHETVTPLEGLVVDDHGFVLEGDYRGSTVQGIVVNESGERIDLVELRVRAFDATGAQLGRYLDSTGDLEGETEWAFEVVILEAPADIDRYEIGVLGTP